MIRDSIILLALVVATRGVAQVGTPPLPGEEILRRVEANFAGIEDYTVSLNAKVDIERMKVPDMKATMYFKQPNKVHFVSEGFAMLPKEGVAFNPSNLRDRFTVESIEKDKESYMLTVRPRSDKTVLRRIVLTVNPATWVVEELLTPQIDGRQMKAVFEYQRVQEHLLPSQITVTLSSDTSSAESSDLSPPAQRRSRIPRSGTIVVRYLDYRINTGLADELFKGTKPQ